MKIDRVIIDIFDWIRRTLWYRDGQVQVKPYEVLESRRGKYGMIRRVIRSTPRAVSTYTFVPFRYNRPAIQVRDIHICCDHLRILEEKNKIENRPSRVKASTHRVSVFSASHWLHPDGSYDLKELFSADYDFQGRDHYRSSNLDRDRQAMIIMAKIAINIRDQKPEDIDWRFEVESVAKQVLCTSWRGEIKNS